ncbi:MAG: hypothetical protein K5656_00445, partial [Lachnospiraceae bacterium]|nr:hypothetical protein [Lachnospiraceae bacterium]
MKENENIINENANAINEQVKHLDFSVKLTEYDFEELANAHISRKESHKRKSIVKDWKAKFDQYETDEERTRGFLELMAVDARTWEFVDNTLIPVNVRNSGDIAVVEKYLNENLNNISIYSKARLIKRLDSLYKAKAIKEGTSGIEAKEGIYSDRPELVVKEEESSFELKVNMNKAQTSTNGCYSTCMEMMIKSRGINNIDQEDIRAYRPKLDANVVNEKFAANSKEDIQYNRDEVGSVLEMSDAILAFAPNSMVKSFEILPQTTATNEKTVKELNDMEYDAYERNAALQIIEKINYAIRVDKSPVAISDGAHYITVVGMKGDNLLIKNSLNEGNYKRTENVILKDFVRDILNSNQSFVMSWSADINLSKDGKVIYDLPTNYLKIDEEGNVKTPALLAEDSNWSLSPHENEGVRVGLYSGVDDLPFERANRSLLKNGVLIVEKAYLPKKLNLPYLKKQAEMRTDDVEEELKKSTTSLLGHKIGELGDRPDYYDEQKMREIANKEDMNKDQIEKENRKNEIISNYKYKTITHIEDKPDMAPSGKQYIWNNVGAVAAFQLATAYKAIMPILKKLPARQEKYKELSKRYNDLINRLKSPANRFNDEDIAKYDGISKLDNLNVDGKRYNIELPNRIVSLEGCFKDKNDLYEAIMLIQALQDCFNFEKDFGALSSKQAQNRKKIYNPTMLSAYAENATYLADTNAGNLLKLCSTNPAIANMIGTMASLPEVEDKDLNKSVSISNDVTKNHVEFINTIRDSVKYAFNLMEQDEYNVNNPVFNRKEEFTAKANRLVATYNNLLDKNKKPQTLAELSKQILKSNGDNKVFEGMEKSTRISESINMWKGESKAYSANLDHEERKLIAYLYAIDTAIKNREAEGKTVEEGLAKSINDLVTLYNNSSKAIEAKVEQAIGVKSKIASTLMELDEKYYGEPVLNCISQSRTLFTKICNTVIEREKQLKFEVENKELAAAIKESKNIEDKLNRINDLDKLRNAIEDIKYNIENKKWNESRTKDTKQGLDYLFNNLDKKPELREKIGKAYMLELISSYALLGEHASDEIDSMTGSNSGEHIDPESVAGLKLLANRDFDLYSKYINHIIYLAYRDDSIKLIDRYKDVINSLKFTDEERDRIMSSCIKEYLEKNNGEYTKDYIIRGKKVTETTTVEHAVFSDNGIGIVSVYLEEGYFESYTDDKMEENKEPDDEAFIRLVNGEDEKNQAREEEERLAEEEKKAEEDVEEENNGEAEENYNDDDSEADDYDEKFQKAEENARREREWDENNRLEGGDAEKQRKEEEERKANQAKNEADKKLAEQNKQNEQKLAEQNKQNEQKLAEQNEQNKQNEEDNKSEHENDINTSSKQNNIKAKPANNINANLVNNNPRPILFRLNQMGLRGNVDNQVETIKEIYLSLDNMEDRIEFIFNTHAQLLTMDLKAKTVTEKYDDVINALYDDFEDRYLNPFNKDAYDILQNTYQRFRINYYYQLYAEYIKCRETIDLNDEYRDKKAYFIVRNYNDILSMRKALRYFAIGRDRLNGVQDNEITALVNIIIGKQESTIEDLLTKVNIIDPDEVDYILKRLKVDKNNNVRVFADDIYAKHNPKQNPNEIVSPETKAAALAKKIEEYRDSYIVEKMVKELLTEKGMTKEQRLEFAEFNSMYIEEPSTDGIEDWVESQGKSIVEREDPNRELSFVDEYDEKYVDLIEHKHDMARAKQRKIELSAPTNTRYQWVINLKRDQEGNIDLTQLNENAELENKYASLKKDIRVDLIKNAKKDLDKKAKRLEDDYLMNRISQVFSNRRSSTIFSMFTIWALGSKSAINMTNFTDAADSYELISEFAEFCRRYPTVEANSKEQYLESVRVWNNILLNASNKIKKYKIPDINYDNYDELERVMPELSLLTSMTTDFLQESSHIFYNRFGIDDTQLSEDLMGSKNFDDMYSTLGDIQKLTIPFNYGYSNYSNIMVARDVYPDLFNIASNREQFSKTFSKFKGKTLSELVRKSSHLIETNKLSVADYHNVFDFDNSIKAEYAKVVDFEKKDTIKYLNGKDKKGFKKKIAKYHKHIQEKHKEEVNGTVQSSAISGFMSDMNMQYLKDRLINIPDGDLDAVLRFLNDDSIVGDSRLTQSSLVSQTVNKVLSTYYRTMAYKLGFDKSDLVLVDGLTFEEKWGDKYKDIRDDQINGISAKAIKDHCYQVEFLKMIAKGEGEIRLRNIVYGLSDKLGIEGELVVSVPANRLQNIKHNYFIYKAGVNDIIGKLKAVQNELLTSHPNYDANNVDAAKEEIGYIGSDYFKDMETALNRTILMLEEGNRHGYSENDITKSFMMLKKASNKYYKERKSIFDKRSDSGRKRLNQSEALKNILPEMIVDYKMLRQGINDQLICNLESTFDTASTKDIKAALDKASNP